VISRIHQKLGTAGFIISIVALVAALGGTALAAKGALSAKQKKEVEKIAKKLDKPGAPGATGPAGPAGKDGAPGANGSNGQNGQNGESVTSTPVAGGACGVGGTGAKYTVGGSSTTVCNGKNGTTGFTETLPEGKTETGVWGSTGAVTTRSYNVSFPIPLATAPTAVVVQPGEMNTSAGANQGCPWDGESGTPTAEPGKFCIYVAIEPSNANFGAVFVTHPHWEEFLGEYVGEGVGGASEYGADLKVACQTGGSEAKCVGYGAWAVTAP
jgi:hypothetical protein